MVGSRFFEIDPYGTASITKFNNRTVTRTIAGVITNN